MEGDKVTEAEIIKLEGVALAEAVARDVMWGEPTVSNESYAYWDFGSDDASKRRVIDKRHRIAGGKEFRPDADHNHAAEVRARMCELYPGLYWTIRQCLSETFMPGWQAWLWGLGHNGVDLVAFDASETVAICRVALLAREALG